MQLPVKVRWPGEHPNQWTEVSGLLSTDRAESSYGIPVLVYDGIAHGTAELPPGCRVLVEWRKPRVGPVWDMVQSAIRAGYPVQVQWYGKEFDGSPIGH